MAQRITWIKASISLAAMGTILVILFAVMSNPFNTIIGYVDDEAENMEVSSDVDPFLDMLITIFGTVFAISFLGLAMWFFLSSHQREHEQYPEDQVYRRPPGGQW